MNPLELLDHISSLGFRAAVTKNNRLRLYGPIEDMTAELATEIKRHKSELLDILRVRQATKEALRLFPGAFVIESTFAPNTKRKALCGYPDHAVTDWEGEPGYWICGICHPNPRNVNNNRQSMEDNREVGRSGSPHMATIPTNPGCGS